MAFGKNKKEETKAAQTRANSDKTTEVVPQETQPVAPKSQALPALSGASAEVQARMDEVRNNLESIESFRLPRAKMTASGLELVEGEEPILELEGVIIHTKKTNVYYDTLFNEDEIKPPTCFSPDGEVPSDGEGLEGYKKQHPTCKGCPQAEFGTNQMKSGKACRNLKPMYLLLGDEAIMPRQLTVTPTSLKSANQYLLNLTERGIAYRKVKTRIKLYKDNPRDTYYKMAFTMVGKLDEQRIKDVEFLRNSWMPVMTAQGVDAAEFGHEQGAQAQHVSSEVQGEY